MKFIGAVLLTTLCFDSIGNADSLTSVETVVTMEAAVTDQDPLGEMVKALQAEPEFSGKQLEVCVNGECATVDRRLEDQPRKGGEPEKLQSWSRDVSDVVKAATGGVSGSANVKVTVTHTETKKDGSSKSTSVSVDVTVKANKK